MTGIMLSTVDESLKTTANSVANLIYNLFGYLPAPYVYGAVYDLGDGNNYFEAISVLMFSPIVSVGALCTAGYFIIKEDTFDYKKKSALLQ